MTDVSQSGLTVSPEGTFFRVTQGMDGYKLVAGKQFILEVWDRDPATFKFCDQIELHIQDPRGQKWRISSPVVPPYDKACVAARFWGICFPRGGRYHVMVRVLRNSTEVRRFTFNARPTGTADLRFLVAMLRVALLQLGPVLPAPNWFSDVRVAIATMSQLLPVRDCVEPSLTSVEKTAGLRYEFIPGSYESFPNHYIDWRSIDFDPLYPTLNRAQNDFLAPQRVFNAAVGNSTDHVDITFRFRYNHNGEPMVGGGAFSTNPNRPSEYPTWPSIVSDVPAYTSTVFSHELGHSLGIAAKHFGIPAPPATDIDGHVPEGTTFPWSLYPFNLSTLAPYRRAREAVEDVMVKLTNIGAPCLFSVDYWNMILATLPPFTQDQSGRPTGTGVNPTTSCQCANAKLLHDSVAVNPYKVQITERYIPPEYRYIIPPAPPLLINGGTRAIGKLAFNAILPSSAAGHVVISARQDERPKTVNVSQTGSFAPDLRRCGIRSIWDEDELEYSSTPAKNQETMQTAIKQTVITDGGGIEIAAAKVSRVTEL